jgi:hypothetical protein
MILMRPGRFQQQRSNGDADLRTPASPLLETPPFDPINKKQLDFRFIEV